MRIYDIKNDQELTKITIYLTPDEAIELASYIQDLANNPENHHHHFSELDNKKENIIREIIIAVYTSQNIDQFDQRSREIIADDWKRSPQSPKVMKKASTIYFEDPSSLETILNHLGVDYRDLPKKKPKPWWKLW